MAGVWGDLIGGPFLQWFDTKLLGRPFIHRLELDVVMPTGQYDSKYLINPGSNIWTFEPYYAFTWFLTDKFSTSWRLMYDFHTENSDAFGGRDVTPGQVFHFNYSLEYQILKNFWASAEVHAADGAPGHRSRKTRLHHPRRQAPLPELLLAMQPGKAATVVNVRLGFDPEDTGQAAFPETHWTSLPVPMVEGFVLPEPAVTRLPQAPVETPGSLTQKNRSSI